MLEVVQVTKSFKRASGLGQKKKYPLKDVDMYVCEGEIVGILGKSGEGKSTLANIICGFKKPDCGNVYLNESPLYDKQKRYDFSLGKRVQMISQQPYQSFDPSKTVGAAIEEVLKVNGFAKERKNAVTEAEDLFEKVLLNATLLNRLPSQLSGGEVQRAAIARALAMRPEIIISDEATAMLDVSSQEEIMNIFCRLAKDEGIGVMLISHDDALLKRVANRIYTIDDGIVALCKRS